MNTLIDDAITASMEFEKLMDKTDFDSWFENENPTKFAKIQDVAPFEEFKKNINDLEKICNGMIKEEDAQSAELVNKSSLEKHFPSKLFKAKRWRLKARKSSNKASEKKCYKEAQKVLLDLLISVKELNINKNDEKYILILIYNDLSICFAGLDNSSMSRGYAEEVRMIIEDEESYKKFDQKLGPTNSSKIAGIANHKFVTSKFYDLYTVTLFNQALAEKRSHSYNEAERNFRKIIRYTAKRENDNTLLPNFNYYSALLNLSDLYIDLSRGKEAIELLDKALDELDEKKENDIRYWKGYLAMIDASIDKTEYDNAEKLLEEFFEKNANLVKRHFITSVGFKAVNCYARCEIEKVKNILGDINKSELKKAQKILLDNLTKIKKRKQEGLELKTYKHLSEVHTLLKEDRKAMEYFIGYFSNGEIYNLSKFVKSEKRGKWINDCNDLDFLENFSEGICKFLKCDGRRLRKSPSRDLFFNEIIEKIKKECDEKGQLSRAERIVRKINKLLGEKKGIKYKGNILFKDSSPDKKKGLSKEEIRIRLDINEKEFDKGFFGRSKKLWDNHIIEMIVLRRWNSFSPGLYRESTGSLGGGYFLRIKKVFMEGNNSVKKEEHEQVENIIIDPGYNFVQSFRSEGFHIEDIDTIIITHSHLDHCAELLQIMDLLYQFNKRHESTPYEEQPKRKVNLYLSRGAYIKFSSFTNEGWQEQLKDVIILENLDNMKCSPFKGLTISAIPTPHMDLGGVNAIGLMIEIDGVEGKKGKKMYLFCWDDIPEKDSEKLKLIDFLVQNPQRRQKDGNWVKNAEIKIDDKKTIKVIDKENKENSIILKLNEKENNVTLIEIHGEETYELGFTLGVKKENGKLSIYKKICLGFTGDTPWYSEVREHFGGCDLLCVHLGSIKYQEIGYTADRYNLKIKSKPREIQTRKERLKEFNNTYATANHLLFFGTEDIISHYDKTKKDSLIIVGEFGEELKYGLRVDLCKKLSKGKSIQCLPGDVGQYIVIEKDGTKKVRCNFCESFVRPNEIMTFSYGREDAIHNICKTCDKTLTELQKQAVIKHRVTRH